jgi:hypothetical protein
MQREQQLWRARRPIEVMRLGRARGRQRGTQVLESKPMDEFGAG